MDITVATVSDIPAIVDLGQRIWNETYVDIIGEAQVEYMLRTFQSEDALTSQMSEGYVYLLLKEGDVPVGYAGYQPRKGHLFLSKLYVLDGYRGRGFASAAITHMSEVCRGLGLPSLRLTVNRDNKRAIDAYLHMGFKILCSQDCPIGEGFVMNDYVMELTV